MNLLAERINKFTLSPFTVAAGSTTIPAEPFFLRLLIKRRPRSSAAAIRSFAICLMAAIKINPLALFVSCFGAVHFILPAEEEKNPVD